MAEELTLGKLKVGSRLKFGRYTAGIGTEPQPILWLKASPKCDFITEYAVDQLCYDAGECRQGERYSTSHNEYELSNINQFLNSENDSWFHPTHQYDNPPRYHEHPGFLYNFDPSELDVLEEKELECGISVRVALPTENDIVFQGLPLFKKRGLRAHPSSDLMLTRLTFMSQTQFLNVGTRTPHRSREGCFYTVDYGGYEGSCSSMSAPGIRPMCFPNPNTPCVMVDDGIYEIIPRDTKDVFMDSNDLLSMLGLV